ncbi:hypothetical protein A0U89_05660 [Kozakia baliensis]|uniref:Uncharacterized protein n=1 Tax=Kozakia baliensis TaxID=153496 RepID=A0A1D8UST5_9PROT|nr:hypothetical protein A0U89_05660 [Kozakia baliensis]
MGTPRSWIFNKCGTNFFRDIRKIFTSAGVIYVESKNIYKIISVQTDPWHKDTVLQAHLGRRFLQGRASYRLRCQNISWTPAQNL